MTERSHRLFFALWPDTAMQAALEGATRAIVQASDGRAVPAANFHLTLAFLGSVPESRIEAVRAVAAQLAGTFHLRDEPIDLALDHAEHWRKSEILCAVASATPPIAVSLAEQLKRALLAAGFAPDLKPFRAHATFARKVRRVTCELDMFPVRWTFRDFRLIESRTDAAGSIYSAREIWVLDESPR